MASSEINARAQNGFANSNAYDQHRPSYPPASLQELLSQLRVAGKKRANLVDLAAGTGKFTELLAAREEQYEVIAIEPHDGMRGVLEAKKLQHVTVLPGTAESMPLDDESVDAVIAAQAFHWFANMPALHEIHRVLRPHGVLGMIWNIEDYNSPREHKASSVWEGKAQDLIWTFDDQESRFRHLQWRSVFDEQIKTTPMSLLIAADPMFALPLGEYEEPWTAWLTKDAVWERFNTISHIAVTEGEERERTYKTFMDALNSPEVETNDRGEVGVHGRTISVWASKVPGEGRDSVFGSNS